MSSRNRVKYTTEQTERLEVAFMKSQYPDTHTMDQLASEMNVTTHRISVWFQNRRSKFKRQSKGAHISWMRKQIFNSDVTPSPENLRTFVSQSCHVLSAPSTSESGVYRTQSQPRIPPTESFDHILQASIPYYVSDPVSPQASYSSQTFSEHPMQESPMALSTCQFTATIESPPLSGCMYQFHPDLSVPDQTTAVPYAFYSNNVYQSPTWTQCVARH